MYIHMYIWSLAIIEGIGKFRWKCALSLYARLFLRTLATTRNSARQYFLRDVHDDFSVLLVRGFQLIVGYVIMFILVSSCDTFEFKCFSLNSGFFNTHGYRILDIWWVIWESRAVRFKSSCQQFSEDFSFDRWFSTPWAWLFLVGVSACLVHIHILFLVTFVLKSSYGGVKVSWDLLDFNISVVNKLF